MPANFDREHERLVDHFKRVYAVVAGLALTEACRHTLPANSLSDYQLWMFLALFITLVPIFHGGDRTLDVKYLGHVPRGWLHRAAFLWDDYMLLITALLFVCVAESIPQPGQTGGAPPDPIRFFFWMKATFIFDVAVLAVDGWKTPRLDPDIKLKPYLFWIPMNFMLFLACHWASHIRPVAPPDTGLFAVPPIGRIDFGQMRLTDICRIILLLCLLRTVFDYWVEQRFLFPRGEPPPQAL